MDCFSDPKINRIVMVASSQVGKSELELNIIGYIIDQDPAASFLSIRQTWMRKNFQRCESPR